MKSKAASDLVEALEAMTRISEEGSRNLALARDEAARVNKMFEKGLNEGLGDLPSEQLSERASRFTVEHARRVQRESSFFSALHALMRLYADDASRQRAEKIFALLREIRMIDLGDDPGKFTSEMPPVLPQNDEGAFRDQRDSLGSLLEFRRGMREFMQQRQGSLDRQIERSDGLLAEALAEARAFA